MKNLLKFATATAATAMLASAAQAQQAVTVIGDGAGSPDVEPEVRLIETAVGPLQEGNLVIDINPAADIDGDTGPGTIGFLTINLTNAVLNANSAPGNVAAILTGGSEDSTATNDECLEGSDTVTVAAPGSASAGGSIGDTFVTFSIPDIGNCEGVATGPDAAVDSGGDRDEGHLRITLPIALTSIADANFSVSIATAGGFELFDETYDADTDETGVQPLVSVGPAFSVAFDAQNDAGDDRGLALGLTPPFSAFNTDTTDPLRFRTRIGTLDIEADFNNTTIAGAVLSAAESLEVSVDAGVSADGIDFIRVADVDGSDPLDLERVGTSNTFSGSVTPSAGVVANPGRNVYVFLEGFGTDGTDGTPATTASQGFTGSAILTVNNNQEVEAAGALGSITRDGTESDAFEWVALEQANLNNQFRFTGLQEGSTVFVTVSDINTAPAEDGGNVISDFDLSATDLLSITPGGEAQFSARALGNTLEAENVLDRSDDEVTRATVQFFVEQAGVGIRRLMFNEEGAVNSTAEFVSGN